MSFKHFKNRLTAVNTDVSLYTVPSGKEFVLMKMRVRNVDGASSTNTMTFKTVEGGQTNTVGEISILSSEISKHGASIKRLMEAGSVIMARSSISGMMAEAMGVEFNAGVWSTIHEWGGSSSSSEQSSSSSSEQQGGGGQGNTDTLTISCSDSAVSGTYSKITNSSDAYYYNGTGYEKSGGGVWLYLNEGYWCLHVDGEGMDRFWKDNCSSLNDILGTTNWTNEMAVSTESITVTASGGESVIDGPYSVLVSDYGSGNYVKTSDTCNSHYVYHCSDNGRYLFVTFGEGTYQWAMNTSKIETVQGDMPMMLNCWSSTNYADAASVPGSPVGNYSNPPMGNSSTVQLND